MFIFRLLLLPFTLLGMALGLFGISTRVLLFPLKIIARNTKLVLMLIVIAIVYFTIQHNRNKINEIKARGEQAQQAQSIKPAGVPLVVEKATKFEDGNSSFSTDLYRTMTEDERAQYSTVYYAVMSHVEDGKTWTWNYYNINGTLTPTETFRNPSGNVCRKFKEVLKVHTVQQTLDGTACDNGGGSWCKLKVNATPACGLGGRGGGMFDGLGSMVKGLF